MNKTRLTKILGVISLETFIGGNQPRTAHTVTVRVNGRGAVERMMMAHLLAAAVISAGSACGLTASQVEPVIERSSYDVLIHCKTEQDAHDVRHIMAQAGLLQMVACAMLVLS